MSGWQGRNELMVRQWKLLVLLRRKPWTLLHLANELGVCKRTVYRDIQALEAVPFPIVQEPGNKHQQATWTLDAQPEWPRRQVAPIQELRP